MSSSSTRRTRLCVAGITGREGTFHTLNNRATAPTSSAASRPARAARTSRASPCSTAGRGVPRGPAEHGDDLRAAAVRGRLDPRGRRGRGRAGDRDHRGHPRARRAARLQHAQARPSGHAPDRPELPGHPLAGQGQRGDHPGVFFKEGNVGVVSRSGTLTYQIGNEIAQAGFGCSSIVGIGGDPVPGSSFVDVLELFEADGDRADRAVGRDRRLGRGGGGRVHRRAREQARRRLHRRLHRAGGQADGPRRRDRLGHGRGRRHRRREGAGARSEGRARRAHADRGGAGDRSRPRRSDPRARAVPHALSNPCPRGPHSRHHVRGAAELLRFRASAPRASSDYDDLASRDLLRARRAVARHRRRRGPARRAAVRAFESDPGGATAYGTSVGYLPLRAGSPTGTASSPSGARDQRLDAGRRVPVRAARAARRRGDRRAPDLRPHAAVAAPARRACCTRSSSSRRHRHRRARAQLLADGAGAPARAHHPQLPEPGRLHAVAAKRKRCSSWREHDFVVFEDDPYVELRFSGETLPTMLSMDPERVVYASSFSKTVCPGSASATSSARPS
jgi:hypothetical protein